MGTVSSGLPCRTCCTSVGSTRHVSWSPRLFRTNTLDHSEIKLIIDYWLFIFVIALLSCTMQNFLSILKCKLILVIYYSLLLLPLYHLQCKNRTHSCPFWNVNDWSLIIYCCYCPFMIYNARCFCPFWNSNNYLSFLNYTLLFLPLLPIMQKLLSILKCEWLFIFDCLLLLTLHHLECKTWHTCV